MSQTPSSDVQPDPQVQAQVQLLDEAQELLANGQPRAASQILENLIAAHPESPYVLDMRWTLAQAQEASGDLAAAVEEYRRILKSTPSSQAATESYVQEARRRITALEPNIENVQARPPSVSALLVSPHDLPPRHDLPEWLLQLTHAGINTLVLHIGTGTEKPPRLVGSQGPQTSADRTGAKGVYFRTKWATVLDDLLDHILPLAHERGLAVYGAVALRRLSWLLPPAGWADWAYDPIAREVRPSMALDLFHPGFQDYLDGLLADLADTRIDGLVFLADAPMGPTHGLSRFARAGFRHNFGVDLEPATLFNGMKQQASNGEVVDARHEGGTSSRYPPKFWRWAGWKARERLNVIGQLMEGMRQHSPQLQFVLEVHPEAIHDPVDALVQYSDDLLEAKHAGFDFIMTRARSRAYPQGREEPTLHTSTGDQMPSNLLARFLELMGGSDRAWIVRDLPSGSIFTIPKNLDPNADRVTLGQPVGLLYR